MVWTEFFLIFFTEFVWCQKGREKNYSDLMMICFVKLSAICWYVGDCWILVSFLCFCFEYWIRFYCCRITVCDFLLSSYDDKKGEKWMLCVRGSYSEIISCNEWGGVYAHMLNLFPSFHPLFCHHQKGGECWSWSLSFDVYKTNGWY